MNNNINHSYTYLDNYRINVVSDSNNSNGLNTIFIPGGTGLGSEYIIDFAKNLDLSGKVIVLDYPHDGSNIIADYEITWDKWKNGLIKIIDKFSPCILVAHSFGGMVALSIPELEHKLAGLILINTTPNQSNALHQEEVAKKFNLPDMSLAFTQYMENPNNLSLAKLCETAYKHYFFLPEEMEKGELLLAQSSLNSESLQWSINNFLPMYKAQWMPQHLPTTIVSSEYDYICSPYAFEDKIYKRTNIDSVQIKNAGHFPWINHFQELKLIFNVFYKACQ